MPGKTKKGTASAKTCTYTDYPRQGEVCNFDVTWWGECSKDNKYMFHKSTPCIFLKLNKIYGWIPDYITRREEFPLDMPQQLKDRIESLDDNVIFSLLIFYLSLRYFQTFLMSSFIFLAVFCSVLFFPY